MCVSDVFNLVSRLTSCDAVAIKVGGNSLCANTPLYAIYVNKVNLLEMGYAKSTHEMQMRNFRNVNAISLQ